MSNPDIVPTAQITALLNGLNPILGGIERALETKVYAEQLPLIGTQLGAAFTSGQAAVSAFRTLETKLLAALAQASSLANQTTADVQALINGALVSAGFPAGGVLVTFDTTSHALTLSLNDSATENFTSALGGNFGLPGIALQTNGSANTAIRYALDLVGSVDGSGNFSVATPGSGPALTVGLDVTAPRFSASAALGSSDATLGDLRFSATDEGSSLHGSFALDTGGNATFSGTASLDVALQSDLGSAALPSIAATLAGGWTFNASTVDPASLASFGNTPTLSLQNVTYSLGNFVDNFLKPVLTEVKSILDLQPVQTALQLFTTPLSFLGGITTADPTGNHGLLGTGWKLLDVAGSVDAGGNDTSDGQITLVDFLKLAGVDVTPIVQLLTTIQDVEAWVTALSATSLGSATYDLGSFTILGDVRAAGFDATQSVAQDTSNPAQDLTALLNSLAGGLSGEVMAGTGITTGLSAPTIMTTGQALQSILTNAHFSFPIISNPLQAVQFLLGGTVDLFDTNLPQASIAIGAINAAGAPTSTVPLLDVPFGTPIPGLGLDLTLGAAFDGALGLNFGYDTRGLTEFSAGGFSDPRKILDGLFVQAQTVAGTVEPVVQLSGAVELGATLAAGILGSVGAGGDVGGNLDLAFAQPGKNYINQLEQKLTTNPFSIFTASGRITAGFEAVAKALGFLSWNYSSPRITLAKFDASSVTGAVDGSGPVIPNFTTWAGPANGDFETPANWSPTFATINGIDYYGDATIGGGSAVSFSGGAPADLASLTLGAHGVLTLNGGALTLENATLDSPNSGTIVVGGTTQLTVKGAVDNTGLIRDTGGTIIVSGLMQIYGGGSVALPDAVASVWQSTDPNGLLWNADNTISGGSTIGVALLNQGVLDANGTHALLLGAADTNLGLMEATGTGRLDIAGPLDNTGGTLAASGGGQVVLENGITVTGGTLQTPAVADGSVITSIGSVTLDGGLDPIFIAGLVQPGSLSTLTLTGTFTGAPFATSRGQAAVTSGLGTVLLQGATLTHGALDARAPAVGTAGSIAVSGTATLDGSAGDGSIGLDGYVRVASGNTLVVDGVVDPGLDGGGIELSGGVLRIGNATTDTATFGGILAGGTAGGALLLDDATGSVVTGADAGSELTNNWTIVGSGSLGAGQLAIVNTASGVIAALGNAALVLDGGSPVLNAGLIGALIGTLDLRSSVLNAGGTIGAVGGTTFLDGAVVGGGTIATTFGGSVRVTGSGTLDGTASALAVTHNSQVGVDGGAALTLAGAIVNAGTISVLGNGSVATLVASGSVALSGGGVLALADATGGGNGATQVVTGSNGSSSGGTLDNVDDLIRGYGSLGLGDGALSLVNEAGGTIDATAGGGALVVNTGANPAINHGLLEAAAGGTLDLRGSIANAAAHVLAAGTVLVDGATLSGGTLASTGTGAIQGLGSATLDATANGMTLAAGSTLDVDTGSTLTVTGSFVNHGLMAAIGTTPFTDGGTLVLQGQVFNAGATIAANHGPVSLHGVTVHGGTLVSAQGDLLDVTGSATLDAAAGMTLTAGSGVLVGAGDTLTLDGTLANHGILNLDGNGQAATLLIAGAVTLAGGGGVTLTDASGADGFATQIVTAASAGSGIDNLDNTIGGYGELGAGALALTNEAAGNIDAAGGTLVVDLGRRLLVNRGTMTGAANGALYLRSDVGNAGGTIQAVSGEVDLDGITVTDGLLASTATGFIRVASTGTLAGGAPVAAGVTASPAGGLLTTADLRVGGGKTLVLSGAITNRGLITVQGDGGDGDAGNPANTATLQASGTVALSGGGTIALADNLGAGAPIDQVITGTAAGDTLDNTDNTIAGYGRIGAADGRFTLVNRTAGTVDAIDGTLIVNTGTNGVTNQGLFEATSGTLDLHGTIAGTGGTIAAHGGAVSLDGVIVSGGTLAVTAGSMGVTGSATLDGAAAPVTLTAGSELDVRGGGTLTLDGTLANSGTVDVAGDSYHGSTATVLVAGSATLAGGGTLALHSLNGASTALQVITGIAAGGTLDNRDNTLTGYGRVGAADSRFTLVNAAAGTLDAAGGTLVVDTGPNTVTNQGLFEATSGTLDLHGTINGAGGTLLAAGGAVSLDGVIVSGGTLGVTGGGMAVVGSATLDGAAAPVTLTAGSELDLRGGGTLTLDGTLANSGTIDVAGDSYYSSTATLLVAGGATLAGGGTLALHTFNGPSTLLQVVTGTTQGATLDNRDNTIIGHGELGAGRMTLRNEASGTIEATGGTLVVNTGTSVVVNDGRLEAIAGTLVLQGVVDSTQGKTLLALAGGASGSILLDGGTLRGGTVQTDTGDLGSTLAVSTAGGTLDGRTGAVTLAAGAQAIVGAGGTLTIEGALVNHGTLSVLGSGYAGTAATLVVAGSVDLSGGGLVVLADPTGYGVAATQVVTAGAAGGTLENTDNLIRGYGQLGAGQLALRNDAAGTIEASGPVALTVNTGSHVIGNTGLMEAVAGTLILQSVVDGTQGGTIAALNGGAGTGVVVLDDATLRGGTLRTDLSDAASVLQVGAGGGMLDGTAGAVTLLAGARAVVGAGETLTVQGALVNHGSVIVAGSGYAGTAATLLVAGTVGLSGGGVVVLTDPTGYAATATQVITGASGGATLDNADNLVRGYGRLGAAQLTLHNEAAGTVEAIGGTLTLDTGGNTILDQGLLEAVDGTLVIRSRVDGSAGGTIAALNGGLGAGIVVLDGGTLQGGTVRTDLADAGSYLTVGAGGGTLDGSAVAVTLATGASVVVAAGETLTVAGSLVNHGTVGVQGSGYNATAATLLVAGGITLTGGGVLSLTDPTGYVAFNTQVVTGGTLANIDNLIRGYGQLGAGHLTLRNAPAGTIEAAGGTLVVNTGTTVVVNDGLAEAVGGTLLLASVIDGTGGGTLAALNGAGASGILLLDGGTVRGGAVTTSGTDHASMLTVTANGGTLDGSAGPVTLLSGAQVVVGAGDALTVAGTLVNHGTVSLLGSGYSNTAASLLLAGSVALTGGGTIALADPTGYFSRNTQVITGTSTTATLDNVDNLIAGYGQLGAGQLTLVNEAQGTIEATGGTLVVDTGPVVVTNKALMEAAGGTLVLRGTLDNTHGTLAALSSGTMPGTVLLDGARLRGGLVMTDPAGAASVVTVSANGGTLDGTAGAITLAGNAQLTVNATDTLTLAGTISGPGTISVFGNAYYGQVGTLRLESATTLAGGVTVALSDPSPNHASTSQVVTGATGATLLDNRGGTISGYGLLGGGTLTLHNAAGGTIDAGGGTLVVDTGTVAVVNQGLMEALGGTLELHGTLTNTGTIVAGAGGGLAVAGTVGNTALVEATAGGTITLRGTIAGSGKTGIGAGATLVVDGGLVQGGTLSNAGSIDVTINGGTLDGVAVVNAGTASVVGYSYYGQDATLTIAGTVGLSGGGVLSLLDASPNLSPLSQVIVGADAAATLDNHDNTIIGYGTLGAGRLTLRNEAAGTIEAAGGRLVVDTGGVAASNAGLLEAVGGTLQLDGAVANSGTILAGAAGFVTILGTVGNTGLVEAGATGTVTVAGAIANTAGSITVAAGGQLVLDHGAIHGGMLTSAGSIGVTVNGGTLDGVAVSNSGTASVTGYAYYGQDATLTIGGTVGLAGGGVLALYDASSSVSPVSQVITGAGPGATLDNHDNTITGYGALGAGQLTLVNDAQGTIVATGGRLTVNTGSVAAINAGLLEALGGTLEIDSGVTSTGTILIGAAGGGVILGPVANSGLVRVAAGGGLALGGLITNAGGSVVVDADATLMMVGGGIAGGTLRNAAGGAVEISVAGGTLDGVAFVNAGSASIAGYAYYGQDATLTVGGSVSLTGGGMLSLLDGSSSLSATSQAIAGADAAATLDNVDNTIVGYGQIGLGRLTLVNEAQGTIAATGGGLTLDTGTVAAVNAGLMHAVGGTLALDSAVHNSGTILAGAAGAVVISGALSNAGLVEAGDGGEVAVAAAITNTTGSVQVDGGGTLLFNGGGVHGSRLTNAAGGAVVVTTGGGTLDGVGFVNLGAASVVGYGYYGQTATLTIGGTVLLSGGGVLSLLDASSSLSAGSQVVTGADAGAVLDNVDNTIRGYGALGGGRLTLVNAAQGTIEATGGALTLNTGTLLTTNDGLLEAVGATLVLTSAVANTLGTVRALGGGSVVLDGGSISGGSITTDGTSGLLLTANGGTLAGVSLAAGSQATVAAGQTLALTGTVGEAGTLSVLGNGYYGQTTAVTLGGTLILSGAGELLLADASGITTASATQLVRGAAGALLDNAARVHGYGTIASGVLNEITGTVEAAGGTLMLATGTVALANAGLLQALSGTLDVAGGVANDGTIRANGGAVVVAGSVTGAGLLELGGSSLTLGGSVAGSQVILFDPGTVGTLDLSDPQGLSGVIGGFTVGDSILLDSTALTAVSYHAIASGFGLLSLYNGAARVAALTLAGDYGGSVFAMAPSGSGSAITLHAGSAATAAANSDAFAWTGTSGGYWSDGQAWADSTSGTNPAGLQPGAATAVTIAGTGAGYMAIAGGGIAASALLTGNVNLVDKYTLGGALTLGTPASVAQPSATAGSLLLSAGAAVTAGSVMLNSGTVTLGAPGAWLNVLGYATVGVAGGANLPDGTGYDYQSGTAGTIDVEAGGSLTVSGALVMANGSLVVNGMGAGAVVGALFSGTAPTDPAVLPYQSGSAGDVTVSNGGSLDILGGLREPDGIVSVTGPDSVLIVVGTLSLGDPPGASYAFGVFNGGSASVGGLAFTGYGIDTTSNGLTIDGTSSVEVGTGGTAAPGSLAIDAGNTVTADVSTHITAPSIVDDGTLGTTGGTLTVNGALSGTGDLRVGSGAVLDLNGSVRTGLSVTFGPGGGLLQLDDPLDFSGTITNFGPGDVIAFGSGTVVSDSLDPTGHTLTLFGAGSITVGTLNFAGAVTAGDVGVNPDGSIGSPVTCFVAGTLIETSCGPVAVEDLRVGDTMDALFGGPAQPIVWIGRRHVVCARHNRPQAVHPVRISAGAFGRGRPDRDLLLSPDHAIFLDGVLVPVKLLVNGSTIARVPMDEVTYYHIELPQHDVVLAEGLAVESYLDTGDRSSYANGGGVVRLFPDFTARAWETAGCAPLVLTGPLLARARAEVARWTAGEQGRAPARRDGRRPGGSRSSPVSSSRGTPAGRMG